MNNNHNMKKGVMIKNGITSHTHYRMSTQTKVT